MRTLHWRSRTGTAARPAPGLRYRVLLRAAALGTACVLLAACGGTGGGDATGPTAAAPMQNLLGKTRQGGSVTMLMTGLTTRFDPIAQPAFGFVSNAPMNAIYGLLSYNESATNEIKMGFLESLTPDAEHRVWTLKLPPGLKFSDGTDFDAAAIKFNLERHADPILGPKYISQAQQLTSEVVDKTTLKVTLDKPNVHFDAVLNESFPYIASPTAVQQLGADFGANPVGAGPFKFVRMEGSTKLVLERNPYYELFAPGEPRLDSITFEVVNDFPRQLQALASGQAQISAPYGGDATRMFREQPNLNVFVNQTGAGSNVQMSLKRPPFDDPRAREAFILALDRAAVANAFQPGTPPQTNLFPPNSPFFDPKFDYAPPDRERAQQLFDELAAEGKPVEFTYTTTDSPQALICAQLIQSQLASYRNVKMEIKSLPSPQYVADQHSGNYQMIPNGLYLINPIPELQDYFVTNGSLNTMGYSNPQVDAAVETLQSETDEARRRAAYGIIQEQTQADHAVYWVGQGLLGFAANKDLTGIVPVNYGNAPLWGPLGYKAEE